MFTSYKMNQQNFKSMKYCVICGKTDTSSTNKRRYQQLDNNQYFFCEHYLKTKPESFNHPFSDVQVKKNELRDDFVSWNEAYIKLRKFAFNNKCLIHANHIKESICFNKEGNEMSKIICQKCFLLNHANCSDKS